jgi:fluoroquinolone resistance protein
MAKRHRARTSVELIRGRPRSTAEMEYAVRIRPCATCGQVYAEGDLERIGPVHQRISRWTCPGCGAARAYRFEFWPPLPDGMPPNQHLGGPEPSEVITPALFAAEARRLTPLAPDRPTGLDAAGWRAGRSIIWRMLVCLHELAKFDGPDVSADLVRYRDVLERHDADRHRIYELERWTDPPPPPARGEVTDSAVHRHEQWVRRGRTGPGRLDVANLRIHFWNRLQTRDLSGARLEACVLDQINLQYAVLSGAELVRCRAQGTALLSVRLDRATVIDCDLTNAPMRLANLRATVVLGGVWKATLLHRANLAGARFDGVRMWGADLWDARLDGATFVGCDLRGARLDRAADPWGTAVGARFVRCDLRDATGLDLRGASFVDCRLTP